MVYSPEQGLAVALFNAKVCSDLDAAFPAASETLRLLTQMGFAVVDVDHAAPLEQARRESAMHLAIVVRRDQCRGSDLCCANCGEPLGGKHSVLCHAYNKARREAERGRLG